MRPLSPTELQVIAAAAAGLGVKETATLMQRSVHTVKHHRKRAMAKLGGTTMHHAVAIAVARGLVEVPL